ncbi:hypothetical protein [Actinomyces gerencseriae]|uniref:hypothetical protein n=1 Tax=Actinomyces gerencseriae TaxID=52769 RepID=UPI00042A8554|nr:hypothetical protein [Actinomyces gerencseriae]
MTYTSESRTPQAAISSRRMARRLLSGAGCASLTAYRLDDGAPSQLVLHALDVTGSIIVAAHPAADHPMVDVPCEAPVEVRLDVALEAAEPGLRITTATVHLLGVLTWLDDGGRDAVLSGSVAGCHCAITGEDPLTDLAELARAPGGRLGVVETSRIMVHDAMGVSGHTMEEVLDPDAKGVRPLLWSASETFGAQDEVKALGEGALEVLCDGVEQGSVPGIICSRRPSGGLHEALWGRVLCVDVSPHAVTLLRLGRETTDTLQILLPAGTTRAHEAGRHLRYLVQEALVGGILP